MAYYRTISQGIVSLLLLAICTLAGGVGCTSAKVRTVSGEPGDPGATIQEQKVVASMNEHSKLGVLYLGLEKWPEAEQSFNQALAADPKDHRSLFGLGIAQEHLGRAEEAKKSYERAYLLSGGQEEYLAAHKRVMGDRG